jgi:hypothetical protein
MNKWGGRNHQKPRQWVTRYLLTKPIVFHKKSDINNFNDFLFGMNLKKKDSKTITDCIYSLNKNFKEFKEEVERMKPKRLNKNTVRP